MTDFRYLTYPQEILFGANTFRQVREVLEQYHTSRAMLVTTHSQRANGTVLRLTAALRETLVAVFDAVQPHVPQANVDASVSLAQEHSADVLIALGGGSPIGVAKATSQAIASQSINALPIIAIPTTYAGSEVTPVFGVTRLVNNVPIKVTVNDPAIVPRVVIYDPLLTLDLPREMIASTGINAFAHCVEAVYSISRNPLSTAAALQGAQKIYAALPRCYQNGSDLDTRTEMLSGSYLAGISLANVAMGLHHGVCHVLGGTAGIPHGITNAIVLPHAIRFNADVCAPELAQIARAMNLPPADDETLAHAAADHIATLVAQMNLPTRLRDAGIREQDLPTLAQLAFKNRNVQNNPKPIPTLETMQHFLQTMY
ncbi:MAG TPA: iron-containing alcohol dehydrogenase [Anaerolineae bacterium]|nr:iron-containing alcohol dehydrogenase [Anaerolineae bacterium]